MVFDVFRKTLTLGLVFQNVSNSFLNFMWSSCFFFLVSFKSLKLLFVHVLICPKCSPNREVYYQKSKQSGDSVNESNSCSLLISVASSLDLPAVIPNIQQIDECIKATLFDYFVR